MLRSNESLPMNAKSILVFILTLSLLMAALPIVPVLADYGNAKQAAVTGPVTSKPGTVVAAPVGMSATGSSLQEGTPTSLTDMTFSEAFPDSIFLDYVLREVFGLAKPETAIIGDDEKAKMAEITDLTLFEMGITSLAGIEYFTGLKNLVLSYNKLTEVDLSNNLNLITLLIDENSLIELNISANTELTLLEASYNKLAILDVSKNTKLEYLYIRYNLLENVDTSNNPKLLQLDLSANRLTGLDVSKNTNLEFLFVDKNNLNSDDLIIGWRSISLVINHPSATVPNATFYFYPQQYIPAPTILPDEEDGIISWNAVNGAKWYYIFAGNSLVNPKDPILVSNNENITDFDLRRILKSPEYYKAGEGKQLELVIQVSPAGGDSPVYSEHSAELSEPVTFTVPLLIDTPEISIDEDDGYTLRWGAIPDVHGYIIYISDTNGGVNDKSEKLGSWDVDDSGAYTDLSSLDLKVGKHYIKIRAVALEGFGISEISNTVEFEVKRPEGEKDEDPNGKGGNEGGSGDGPGISVEVIPDWTTLEKALKTSINYGNSTLSAFLTFTEKGQTVTGEPGIFELKDPHSFPQAGDKRAIKVTFTTDGGVGSAEKDFFIKVNKKPLSPNMVSISGIYEYTGNEIKPSYTVSDTAVSGETGSRVELIKASDYAVSFSSNVNVGTATIRVQASTNSNYSEYAMRSFNIIKAKPAGTPVITVITTAGMTLADAKITLPSGGFKNPTSNITVPGRLSWDDGDTQTVKEKTAYKWTFTPTDTRNYSTATGSLVPYPTDNPGIIETEVPDEEVGKLFLDVIHSAWYEEAVMYMFEQCLMNGTSTEPMLFSPNIPLSRAMIVTILYRYEGEPDIDGFEKPFSDVPEESWYTDAVIWMAENGIVTGLPDGRFAPGDNITRQDLAAILTRYADFKDRELPVIREYLGFADDSSIADYASEAVQRCYEAGIINGRYGNIFDPQGNATRAEAAAMLYRFLKT